MHDMPHPRNGGIRRRSFCAALLAASGTGHAQPTPRPLKLIVPYATGSATDAVARAIGPMVFDALGHAVVVENAPGANGIPATAAFVSKGADSGSLLVIAANHVVNPSLYSNVPYNVTKDFRGIARIGHIPFVLCVTSETAVSDVAGLVRLIKAKPGQFSYSSPGNGSPPHLAMELFKSMAGLHVVHIPYRGAGQALMDLLGGQVQLSFIVESAAIPQIRNGKLKPLAISSVDRSANLPSVPSMSEAGFKGYDLVTWLGIVAHGQTPSEQVRLLSNSVIAGLRRPELQEQLARIGLKVAPLPAAEFDAYMASEGAKWGKIVRDSGTKLD